ncbi:formyl transferase [Rhizobium sp. CG5]|uniref:formyl transferase n=1 Tax=Rhizobium sp. CG5 TaxID=2726076 RepID=UPI00203432F6|nr:formyl transferase [Rhizobium sp. CG5]MCM2474692.1 formyl transferase [Rhizobium sp. CG5]
MTAGGQNPTIVINALHARYPDLHVIEESPESKLEIWRRRAKRLGVLQATGQLATMIAARLLRKAAQTRVDEICKTFRLDPNPNPQIPVHKVASINDANTLAHIADLNPAVVLLVSTRLLSRHALSAMPCPVLNLHAGINPAYRGQMGGYWSLVEGDRENFGATVHLVDAGTDTGGTLYEVRTTPAKGDFIATYPMLLTAAALDIVARAVADAVNGTLAPTAPTGPSHLRFPPALWTWISVGLTRRIW